MNKGIIKLRPVRSPQEGMQVVAQLSNKLQIGIIEKSPPINPFPVKFKNERSWYYVDKSHTLQELVVEYEEEGPIYEWIDKKELLIRYDQWEECLPLIGKEVQWAEFEIFTPKHCIMADIFPYPQQKQEDSVEQQMYSEEEVKAAYEEGCRVASPFGNQGLSKYEKENWERYWKQNKKGGK